MLLKDLRIYFLPIMVSNSLWKQIKQFHSFHSKRRLLHTSNCSRGMPVNILGLDLVTPSHIIGKLDVIPMYESLGQFPQNITWYLSLLLS